MKLQFLLTVAVCTTAWGQSGEETFAVGGYAKYLFSRSSIPLLGKLTDHAIHARLNTKWYVSKTVSAALEIRARGYAGGTVENTPDFVGLIRNDHEFSHLDATLWDASSSAGLRA